MLSMGERKAPLFQDPWFQYGRIMNNKDHWVINEGHDENCDAYNSRSSSTSSFEASTISNESSSSSIDTTDDASSSLSSCLSSSNCNEGLYDLSELMAELPIKRGLSKYYQGRSESFTCLSRVTSLEDLAKKVAPHRRKMKTSKSYGGLDNYKSYTLPKRVISKKASRGGSVSSSSLSGSGSSISSCRPPMIPVQKISRC